MKTKVAIKSENIPPFGGIFYVIDEFSRLGMDKLIDRVLGLRCSTYGYQYSEILSSVFYTYYCGGDHIEDIGHRLGTHLELRPDTQIPSPDTVLRGIKELATENIVYQSDTLKRIFQRLANRGVFINRCRMDCGSYSKEIIVTVHGYCNKFYIHLLWQT